MRKRPSSGYPGAFLGLTAGLMVVYLASLGAGAALASPAGVLSPQQPPGVTLTLYVHEGSASGPVIPGAQVNVLRSGGSTVDLVTNADGFVTVSGSPGTWSFLVSRQGYRPLSTIESVTATGELHLFLQRLDGLTPALPPTPTLGLETPADPAGGLTPTVEPSDPSNERSDVPWETIWVAVGALATLATAIIAVIGLRRNRGP